MNTKSTRSTYSNFLLLPLSLALALSGTACKKPAGSEPVTAPTASKEPGSSEAKPVPSAESKPAAVPMSNSKVLVFRNVRSWNRKVDFEDVLAKLELEFDVRHSAEIENTDLAPYGFVIIPGAQWQDDFYRHYADNLARFDRYVTNGGTLLLELNGAERDGITLPRGVDMVSHGSTENAIMVPAHPILIPLAGKPIRANYASHGYLEGVPKDAIVLVTEMVEGQSAMDKPTFVEYNHGAGRVIAACQCFHDRDGSGRGPLMETAIRYAAARQWFKE